MSVCECSGMILTPQEKWLEGMIKNEDKGRERTFRRLDAVRKSTVLLCTDRARLFTESMKTTENKPLELRWALALKHIAENMPIYIGEDDLIVGRGESRQGRCAMLYPEVDGGYMDRVGENMCDREDAQFYVSKEDAKIMSEEIAPYWKDKSWPEVYAGYLPEETKTAIFGPDKENIYYQSGMVFVSGNNRSSQNWVQDYPKVLKRGIKDIKREAEERLAAIKYPEERITKGIFLEASIISCDAIVIWANRHAQVAREMAAKESNPDRKKELLEIAEVCDWVPENPARTFKEALQAEWFVYMFTRLEQLVAGSLSLGRLDQILYPYYKKDMEEGRITRNEARELLESVWVNLSEAMICLVSPAAGAFTEGFAHFEGVTIGGQTRDGRDAVNDLSYLILESKKGLPINYPDLAVRIHAQTPEKFLKAVVEVIKDGQGYPKLLNDEEIVPMYLAKGIKPEDALDYCVTGCAEHRVPNRETYIHPGAVVNMGTALEMVLYNGRTKKFGDVKIGPETGDPRKFATYEEFFAAYRTQHLYLLDQCLIQQAVLDKVVPEYLATPFTSTLHDIANEQCKDLNEYVAGGMREVFADYCGFGTIADSLAAIKKLVYEDKKLTMDELVEAVKTNFEGKEAIRQMCLHAPKYGNNDLYVDNIAKEIETFHMQYLEDQKYEVPQILSSRILPITIHILMGKMTGATPNGRKAGTPLSEGASASHGCDTNGPTALLKSNANSKNRSGRNRQARLLNMKLSPNSVKGEEGTRKLMSLIRSWCDLKVNHIQFNIINKETLLAAQKDPEKYRSLIVRVAGYSAYFTELSKQLQDEIISRTEHDI